MTDHIEMTIAEAEAFKMGLHIGQNSKQSLEEEIELLREEMGLSRYEQAPEDAYYLRALEKLESVTDPGGTLGDIDKEKRTA